MIGTDLRQAELRQADFSDCHLDHAVLDGAVLVQANLSGARGERVSMVTADFMLLVTAKTGHSPRSCLKTGFSGKIPWIKRSAVVGDVLMSAFIFQGTVFAIAKGSAEIHGCRIDDVHHAFG